MTKKILWLSFILLLAGFLGVAWQLLNPQPASRPVPIGNANASVSEAKQPSTSVFSNSERQVQLLVAKNSHPRGSRFKDIEWQWKSFPQSHADSLIQPIQKNSDSLQLWQNSVLLKSVKSGQPVSELSLIQPDQPGFLAAAVADGHRGVSIPVSRVSASNGLVSPGDFVDVVLTSFLNQGKGESFADVASLRTRTVVEKVRVLAINDAASELPATAKPDVKRFFNDSSATIEATPQQAQKLLLASRMGELALNLRSAADISEVSENAELQLGDLFQDTRVVGPELGLVEMRGSETSRVGEQKSKKDAEDE